MTDIDFKPSSPVRPTSIYVSWQLFKALGYVAKKTGCTREDAVEIILRNHIAEEYPDILEWLKKRETDEREFINKLQTAKETQEKFTPTTADIMT